MRIIKSVSMTILMAFATLGLSSGSGADAAIIDVVSGPGSLSITTPVGVAGNLGFNVIVRTDDIRRTIVTTTEGVLGADQGKFGITKFGFTASNFFIGTEFEVRQYTFVYNLSFASLAPGTFNTGSFFTFKFECSSGTGQFELNPCVEDFIFNDFASQSFPVDPIAIEGIATEQVSAIPLPAALPLYGTGLAVMGFMGWRRKRTALRD